MEIWKRIPGFDGQYEVSDLGRVRSLRFGGHYYMKQDVSRIGYACIHLQQGKESKNCLVHRLVMLAFVGPSDLDVNHKDLDKLNNRLGNLEYVTHRENMLHARETKSDWAKREPSPATPRDRAIRRMAKLGLSQRAIARRFDISQPYVHYIVSGKARPENSYQ